MKKIKKYKLNFSQAKTNFLDKVNSVNTLSKKVCEIVDLNSGSFYTFFPETEKAPSAINLFRGSLTKPADRQFFYQFILNNLQKTDNRICIFDDFESKYQPGYEEELFKSHGKFLNEEIYYLFSKENASLEKIQTAFRYCDIMWHSLIIISTSKLDFLPDQTISENDCIKICEKADLILVTAYDAEGYIFWEKTPKNI